MKHRRYSAFLDFLSIQQRSASIPPSASKSMTLFSPLKPTPIAPEWSSPWHHMMTMLRKIECIKIESLSGTDTRTHAIEIFEATSVNRIPTNRSRSRGRSTELVARVERGYAEFGALRVQVYMIVHNAHADSPCEFCKSVMDVVVLGDRGPARRLLQRLIALVKHNGGTRGCSGQTQVAQVLYAFLFQQHAGD